MYQNHRYYRRTHYTLKPKRNYRLKIACLIACCLIVGVVAKNILPAEGETKGANTAVQPKEPEKPKKVVDLTLLPESLKQVIGKFPYDTSVSVVEINSGKTIHVGDPHQYIAASTTKILTAILYLHNVEQGQASLDDQIGGVSAREQLQLMVNRSDNDAWRQLNGHLSHEKLQAYALQQGMTSYDPKENKVTSDDMASLLAKLYKRELINDENTKLLLSWMQKTEQESFIPPAMPAGVNLYHKSGYLEERAHDAAIIDNGFTPFVLVIYSKAYGPSYNFEMGQRLFSQVAAETLNTFNK